MARTSLGRVSMVFRGAYSTATAYVALDVVTHAGSAYVCTAATTGNEPPNAVYWHQIAAKGDTGSAGENGTDGADGMDGYSPTVSVTAIAGGNRITITDASGTQTFDVLNGAGAGDMLTSVYDQNGNGVVDNAEKLGGDLPSAFAASSHTHSGLETRLSDVEDAVDGIEALLAAI